MAFRKYSCEIQCKEGRRWVYTVFGNVSVYRCMFNVWLFTDVDRYPTSWYVVSVCIHVFKQWPHDDLYLSLKLLARLQTFAKDSNESTN